MSHDDRQSEALLRHMQRLESLLAETAPAALSPGDRLRAQRLAGRLGRVAAGESHPSSPSDELVGDAPAMRRLRQLIRRIAPCDSHVLILGESGTGKELAARALHAGSPRRSGRFVAVDCGALSDTLLESELFGHRRGSFTGAMLDRAGLLEEADGGTLFLDELANASAGFQTRLLRVLQEGRLRRLGENRERALSLRVVAATSGDVPSLVAGGSFRADLYYRINVLALELPPLRARRQDIPVLAAHFLSEVELRHGTGPRRLSPAALEILVRYRWPGNVRELRNVLERAALLAMGEVITPEALPGALLDDLLDPAALASSERPKSGEQRLVERALLQTDGDRTRAARLIGWPRSKLYRRLRRFGIPSEFGRRPPEGG